MAPRQKTLKDSCILESIKGRGKSLFLRLFLSHRWVQTAVSSVRKLLGHAPIYIRGKPSFRLNSAYHRSPRYNRQKQETTWDLFIISKCGLLVNCKILILLHKLWKLSFLPMHNGKGEGTDGEWCQHDTAHCFQNNQEDPWVTSAPTSFRSVAIVINRKLNF